jgi:hypothetical protein
MIIQLKSTSKNNLVGALLGTNIQHIDRIELFLPTAS